AFPFTSGGPRPVRMATRSEAATRRASARVTSSVAATSPVATGAAAPTAASHIDAAATAVTLRHHLLFAFLRFTPIGEAVLAGRILTATRSGIRRAAGTRECRRAKQHQRDARRGFTWTVRHRPRIIADASVPAPRNRCTEAGLEAQSKNRQGSEMNPGSKPTFSNRRWVAGPV